MVDFEKKSKSGREVIVEPSRPAPGYCALERLPCLSPLSVSDHSASALARGSARMDIIKGKERKKDKCQGRGERKEKSNQEGANQGKKIKRMLGKRNKKNRNRGNIIMIFECI